MALYIPGFRFHSDLFPIQPGEDREVNPFCYGKSLAEWIAPKFQALGYRVDAPFAEDWGWCVTLGHEDFMLWIGCGGQLDQEPPDMSDEAREAFAPDPAAVEWSCLVGTDVPVLKRLFRKVDTRPMVDKVAGELEAILRAEPRIRDIETLD